MDKMIVILGPTASGKTGIAVKLADAIEGEIISADSRQIYKGMDIGTGKDLDEYYYNKHIIVNYLIDIIEPPEDYSVYQFRKDFLQALSSVKSNNSTPILCGGTGLYIESILLDYQMPKTPPNKQLRKKLENYSFDELCKHLKEKDESKYDENYHTSKRRMIRTLEILEESKISSIQMNKTGSNILDSTLVIGINTERALLLKRIKNRLHERLNNGMIEEVKLLLEQGISFERLQYFGLEYKHIGEYLSKKTDYNSMVERLNFAINRFSKRQMTFFRRMEKRGININWISLDKPNNILDLADKFLKK